MSYVYVVHPKDFSSGYGPTAVFESREEAGTYLKNLTVQVSKRRDAEDCHTLVGTIRHLHRHTYMVVYEETLEESNVVEFLNEGVHLCLKVSEVPVYRKVGEE